MKRFLTLLTLLAAVLSSCKEENLSVEPSASAEILSIGANSACIELRTNALTSYAYVIYGTDDDLAALPEAVTVFRGGETGSLVDGKNEVVISGLDVQTSYHVYFAFGAASGEFYDDIVDLAFITTNFEDTITVFNLDKDGFAVHIVIPEEVAEEGNALRYFYSDLFVYNSNKMSDWSDAENLLMNGGYYILEDTTIYYDPESIAAADYGYADPIVPGQPGVFCVGEFAWGQAAIYANDGWYVYQFDLYQWMLDRGYEEEDIDTTYMSASPATKTIDYDETSYWYGYYDRIDVVTEAPDLFDGEVEVEAEVGSTRGYLYLTPGEGVEMYTFMILDDATYKSLINILGSEDYMQWFTSSFVAYYYLGTVTYTGKAYFDITNVIYLEPEILYHVCLVGFGDEEGHSQFYQHSTFNTTEYALDAPEVVVTAIDNPNGESPYEVWFNIKAPNGDLDYCYYAGNYEREWVQAMSYYGSYSSIVSSSANSFSTTEVAAINSASGYDVMFHSRANATTILAVQGYNEEDKCNDLDDENTTAIARSTTCAETYERIESELFTSLVGDWTMTYTLAETTSIEGGEYQTSVQILSGLSCPDELGDEGVAAYEAIGVSEADARAMYETLKDECEAFNESVRGNNRLLCHGFGLDSDANFALPYDLFISSTYSSYNEWSMIYDYGRKWYIEIFEDGTIGIPFNSVRMYPMSSWQTSYKSYMTYFLVGRDINSASVTTGYLSVGDDYETLYFPAEVSEDGNTITIHPYVYYDTDYYPNIARAYSSYVTFPYGKICSDIVLSKNSSSSSSDTVELTFDASTSARRTASETEVEAGSGSVAPASVAPADDLEKVGIANNVDPTNMVKAKSRTTLFGREDGGSVKVNTLDDLKSAVEAVRYKKR